MAGLGSFRIRRDTMGIAVCDLDAAAFLRTVRRHGGSSEHPDGVTSQFERELRAGRPGFGVLGLRTCDRLAGGISFGQMALPRQPEARGARIDVVLTQPEVRGQGIGSILVSTLIDRLDRELGERLRLVSVVAVHPAIVRIAEELGFEGLVGSATPLFTLRLDEPSARERALAHVRQVLATRVGKLREGCVECQRGPWATAWCGGPAGPEADDAH